VRDRAALRQRALNLLLRAADSGIDVVQANAFEALVHVAPDAGRPYFAAALDSDVPMVRFAACEAIGDIRDREALEALNAIVHPLVRKEVARRLLDVAREDPTAVVVIEAALMAETGWRGGAGTLWVVLADPEVVVERLVRLRGMDPEEVRLRLATQASNEERRRVATKVIENNGTLEELEAKVDAAWREYLESRAT